MWRQRLTSGWKQWVCTQTKQTYQQISQGTPINQLGGNSNAMALRYASVFAYYSTEEEAVDAALKTMFTHRERTAKLGCEFFARVVYRVIHKGLTPVDAIGQVSSESDKWIQKKVQQGLDKAHEATDENKPLSREEFVDDLALTSMARLWDVGKSEPIKVGNSFYDGVLLVHTSYSCALLIASFVQYQGRKSKSYRGNFARSHLLHS